METTPLGLWTKNYFEQVGDRCKAREEEVLEVSHIDPEAAFIIRCDGRAFHTFTKGLDKPFDYAFSDAMKRATSEVMKQFKPRFAYFQSDEITFVFSGGEYQTNGYTHPFGGRVTKLLTTIASAVSVEFCKALNDIRSGALLAGKRWPTFDARLVDIFSPDAMVSDILHSVMWRENDAMRNSIAMAAQSMFSHSELQGANVAKQVEMMEGNGVSWRGLPAKQRRGTYLKMVTEDRVLTEEERARIPEDVRPDEGTTFKRSTIKEFYFEDWAYLPRNEALWQK